ncbi:positive regulator of SKD1 [Hibiscus trionum]|uniref:Positive regulator of SKD1 n=1 Tax=Hibiscus trionum TaxID=183268 RepID=A0A9W7HC14_HIBTR|nr:positive regulator of SKD1 [Hibiscus trionum]
MSGRKNSSAATAEFDAVEQLLQATQDEMLLEISVDTHMSRVAPDYLDPDLSRRFQALRSRPSSSRSQQKKQSSAPAPLPPQPLKPQPEQKEDEERKEQKSKVVVADHVDEELKAVLGDDLSARFAALKASLSSSSSNPTIASTTNEVRIGLEKSDGEVDEEDEVERVIQWAKDAARLDPSPASDDDDDLIGSDSDDNETDYDSDPKPKKKETKSRK